MRTELNGGNYVLETALAAETSYDLRLVVGILCILNPNFCTVAEHKLIAEISAHPEIALVSVKYYQQLLTSKMQNANGRTADYQQLFSSLAHAELTLVRLFQKNQQRAKEKVTNPKSALR